MDMVDVAIVAFPPSPCTIANTFPHSSCNGPINRSLRSLSPFFASKVTVTLASPSKASKALPCNCFSFDNNKVSANFLAITSTHAVNFVNKVASAQLPQEITDVDVDVDDGSGMGVGVWEDVLSVLCGE